jgi:hypothetical protein
MQMGAQALRNTPLDLETTLFKGSLALHTAVSQAMAYASLTDDYRQQLRMSL